MTVTLSSFLAKRNGCKTQENPEAGPGKGEVHVFNICTGRSMTCRI
jgi:hypothetical protein